MCGSAARFSGRGAEPLVGRLSLDDVPPMTSPYHLQTCGLRAPRNSDHHRISITVLGPSREISQRSRLRLHRDAARGRQEARPRQMEEYGAAPPGHPRARVVVDFHNDIIEMVCPAQAVARRSRRAFDRHGCSCDRPDLPTRHQSARSVAAVYWYGAVTPDPPATRFSADEIALSESPITFPFIGKNARAAQRDRDYPAVDDQDALAALARPPPHRKNTGWPGGTHRNARFSAPLIHWFGWPWRW